MHAVFNLQAPEIFVKSYSITQIKCYFKVHLYELCNTQILGACNSIRSTFPRKMVFSKMGYILFYCFIYTFFMNYL